MWKPTKINLLELLAPHPPRTNFHVIGVDEDYTVRVAKTIGRFPWHSHPNGDEGWFVFEGRLCIHTKDGVLELERGDFTVIPRGVPHSPEALVPDTVVIIFNRRDLGMTLNDPDIDLGGFRERDLTKHSIG
jgi:mannose-6-phosphate isomerase-like protein (cupin superfamily)